MLNVTIDPEIDRRLEALGARDEASKTALVRKALLEELDEELEAQDFSRLADERKATEGEERLWTLGELERGDDLAG